MQIINRARLKARNLYRRFFYPASLSYEGPFNFYLLNDNPLVILTFTPCGLGHVEVMAEQIAPRPCHFLVGFWWSMEDVGRVDAFQRNWKRIRNNHPYVDLQVLCNAEKEQQLFRDRTDVQAHHVNHNSFLDEEIWTVEPRRGKQYDAIYNARMGPYKRIELAAEVDSLAVITAPYQGDIEGDHYADKVREQINHADWLNFDEKGRYQRLSCTEVRASLTKAHAGLVLSAKEGACYAVGEYLLSGIPVVSTPSKGGRDVWFNDTTCILVDETPEGVAQGVREWKKRSPNPHRVRQAALEIMREHRCRLFGIVDEIRRGYGVRRSFREEWDGRFYNKMNFKTDPDRFAELLDHKRFLAAVRKDVAEAT